MKSSRFYLLFALVMAGSSFAGDTVLNGSFVWGNKSGQRHDLKATLTPDGAKKWKAVYDFQWKDKPMQYVGTISGEIGDGAFEGTGQTKDGKRTWTLKGTAKSGVLDFEHHETTKGREGATGTATLKPAPAKS